MSYLASDAVFDLLEKVSQASGYNKRSLLHPELKPYLQAAYNPYKRYFVTNANTGIGKDQFSTITWNLLAHLAKRSVSGHEAQNVINEHTKDMTWKSAELFRRILKKDLRIGMGAKTINKVFAELIPEHPIMLGKLFQATRVRFPCFISPKIDGVRAIYKFGEFYSRKGHKYVGLNHLKEQLKDIHTPLDGELTVPGRSFQVGSGLVRSNDPTPNAQFSIFELPEESGSFSERLVMIRDLHQHGPNIVHIPHTVAADYEYITKYYEACRLRGFEGAMVKPFDYQYVGNRSWWWMKMKPTKEADLEVLDVYEGRGKYTGQLGGIVVNFHGRNDKVGTGFSDQQRVDFWNDTSLVIGRTAAVLYMEETDDGSMRHSRFDKVRVDK